jgi:hypothetical protein
MSPIDTLQIKITLDRIKPDIWRRFIVDTSFSLHKLHRSIQTVMGWYDAHLYEFEIQNSHYSITDQNDNFLDYEVLDSKKTKLKSLGLQPEDTFNYTYDFGDNWEHTIVIERVLKIGPVMAPLCLDGERNCPPEDCGSVPGYQHIMELMQNPDSKEAREFTKLLGHPYNSELFDINAINDGLKNLSRRKTKALVEKQPQECFSLETKTEE